MDFLAATESQSGFPPYFVRASKLLQKIQEGQLNITLPDGYSFRFAGDTTGVCADIHIKNPGFFARIVRDGSLAFSESYMDGWWETPDLQAVLDLIQRPKNNFISKSLPGAFIVRSIEKMRFWMKSNSRKQAKRNIHQHYDLGNSFYRLWLDETMTYSSALFDNPAEALESAQKRKYANMIEQIGTKPGDHILEIGCGWGGFAEYAAKEHDLHVTGLTISKAQYDYSRNRIKAAGLTDRVTIKLQDYRDEGGLYDGIASIEMFEAVGEKYWNKYFSVIRNCLKPKGKATIQTIIVPDHRWREYNRCVDFIQKYIFPGGKLPAPFRLKEEVSRAGMALCQSVDFGESYSLTLRRWYKTFNERWDEISHLGFDMRFRRMWNFYLTSCAGAFQGGNCSVLQVTLSHSK